jgi:hypothetical protein
MTPATELLLHVDRTERLELARVWVLANVPSGSAQTKAVALLDAELAATKQLARVMLDALP